MSAVARSASDFDDTTLRSDYDLNLLLNMKDRVRREDEELRRQEEAGDAAQTKAEQEEFERIMIEKAMEAIRQAELAGS